MKDLRIKKIAAREYLFLIKSGIILSILFGILLAVINQINIGRQNRILQHTKLVLEIDSLEKREGSQKFNEASQAKLYKFIHELEYYTKSFDAFTLQFANDSSRNKLFDALCTANLYFGTYQQFNKDYFPPIDIELQSKINNSKISLNNIRINQIINYPKWIWMIYFWLSIYAIRLLIISFKAATNIVNNAENDT